MEFCSLAMKEWTNQIKIATELSVANYGSTIFNFINNCKKCQKSQIFNFKNMGLVKKIKIILIQKMRLKDSNKSLMIKLKTDLKPQKNFRCQKERGEDLKRHANKLRIKHFLHSKA